MSLHWPPTERGHPNVTVGNYLCSLFYAWQYPCKRADMIHELFRRKGGGALAVVLTCRYKFASSP
jgi:hypothetical protein